MLDQFLHYDNEIIVFLNSLGNQHWDFFWLFVTKPLNWIWFFTVVFFLVLKSYGWKKGLQLSLLVVFFAAITLVIVDLIKNGVSRLRPNNNPEIDQLLRTLVDPQAYSFVSGHATFSFFIGVLAFYLLKHKTKLAWLIFIFPAFFAYSRLYLGVHYVSDIVTGALLGFFIAIVGWFSAKKLILKG